MNYILKSLLVIILFTLNCNLLFAEEAKEATESNPADEIHDPFEGWNRGVFWFNDKLDRYVLEPIAIGYDKVTPDPVQRSVGNFFENAKYPSQLVSDLIQFKFHQAAEHTSRFILNTTLGLGGLFDVAEEFGLENKREDFGTALAHHGFKSGPYFMVPLLGPTTLRDGIGRIVDNALDPLRWVIVASTDGSEATAIAAGVTALDVVQTRADMLDAIEAAREASVDYYLFVQSAYYQHRNATIQGKGSKHYLENKANDPFAEDEAFDEEMGE